MTWKGTYVFAPGQVERFVRLLGQRVCIALSDGNRVDDCLLVSVPSDRAQSVWVYTDGADRFLPHHTIVDIWEARS